jgi:hypothetical protein
VEVLRPSEKQSRRAYFASLSDEKLLSTAVDYVWLCQRDDPPWPQFAWSRDVLRTECESRGKLELFAQAVDRCKPVSV